MHKTKLANDLEEALKKIQENVTDQTNTQEQITDEQNDKDILKVCFYTWVLCDQNYKIMFILFGLNLSLT